MEETIGLILIIFWTIWIPWMTLWFGSVILSNMGHPQLNKFILNYLYYFSPLAKRQRQLKLENYIRQHGTEEEKTLDNMVLKKKNLIYIINLTQDIK